MNDNVSSESIVEIKDLTRRFGAKTALDRVDLTVPRGGVFGLVGENGAGKTTLIKHVLGLFKAPKGAVRVFGLDPVKEPVGVLGRIGYLSEDRDMPGWMTVDELMRFTRAFFPNWDDDYAEELRRTFDLDGAQRIKSLSRGQKAQLGLIDALAHRPDLLLLDEPSSGLDPVVRRDILGAIIRTVADEGRTVLFSSHLLDEVERVADCVAMIHQGRMVMSASLDEFKASHSRVVFRFPEPQSAPPALEGVLGWEGHGREWTALCDGRLDRVKDAAAALGADPVEEPPCSLEDIFVARVRVSRAALREE
jgi:ABC-2 type transport system ATP-binding protein